MTSPNGSAIQGTTIVPSLEAVEKYLETQPSTLWGKAYDIHSEAGRKRAAEWFHKQVKGLFEQ